MAERVARANMPHGHICVAARRFVPFSTLRLRSSAYLWHTANAPSEPPPALLQWPRPYRQGEGSIVGIRVGLTILLAASALLILVASTVWLLGVFAEQEAVGQTSSDQTITAPPSASETPKTPSPTPSSPPAAGSEDVLGNSLGSAPADNPASIPDLSVMDVIGNLKYFATDADFRCTGPTVTEGDNILWSCAANTRGRRGSYDVSLVGDDPLTILSVTATVRGVSEERAASFFTYVAGHCLGNTDPLNPEAWMQENVPTGGRTATGGTSLSVYGTKEVRTLEVVASGTF
jgi:hypothetical protein